MNWSSLIQFAFWSELKKKNVCNEQYVRSADLHENKCRWVQIYLHGYPDLKAAVGDLRDDTRRRADSQGCTFHLLRCRPRPFKNRTDSPTHVQRHTHTHLQRLCCHRNYGFRTIQIKLVIVSDTHSASQTALRCSKHMLFRRPKWLTDYRDSVLFHYVTLTDSITNTTAHLQ